MCQTLVVDSLPRVLSKGLREYADQYRHGDMAAATMNASALLGVCHRGYDAIAPLAEIPGYCGSLVHDLVDDAEFAAVWARVLDACSKVPPVAQLVCKLVKGGARPKAIVEPADLARLDTLKTHFSPRRQYTVALERRLKATMSMCGNSFKGFLQLAELSPTELASQPQTIFSLQGRPEMEATLRAHPGGGIWVRLDSWQSPELWGEFLIPVETLRSFM